MAEFDDTVSAKIIQALLDDPDTSAGAEYFMASWATSRSWTMVADVNGDLKCTFSMKPENIVQPDHCGEFGDTLESQWLKMSVDLNDDIYGYNGPEEARRAAIRLRALADDLDAGIVRGSYGKAGG